MKMLKVKLKILLSNLNRILSLLRLEILVQTNIKNTKANTTITNQDFLIFK
jgi:hypothetical protein